MFPSLDSRDRIPRVPTWLNWVFVFALCFIRVQRNFSWNVLRLYAELKWARRAHKVCKFSLHSFSFDHGKWILLQREASDEFWASRTSQLCFIGIAKPQKYFHLRTSLKNSEMKTKRRKCWELEISMKTLREHFFNHPL